MYLIRDKVRIIVLEEMGGEQYRDEMDNFHR